MSTTIASTRLLSSPTVTSCRAPAASPSFEGSVWASWVSSWVIWNLWLSWRNSSLSLAHCWKSLTYVGSLDPSWPTSWMIGGITASTRNVSTAKKRT